MSFIPLTADAVLVFVAVSDVAVVDAFAAVALGLDALDSKRCQRQGYQYVACTWNEAKAGPHCLERSNPG